MIYEIDLVFTSHPTMIYDINGNIRDKKPTISDEINEIDYFANNVLNYLNENKISNIKISSWCGGDRDGHPYITNDITKKLLSKINDKYDLDIRDNSKKIDIFIEEYNLNKDTKIQFINDFDFSTVQDNLIDLIKLMYDDQRFIISDCEEYYHIYFIYKVSKFFDKKIKIVPLFESTKCLKKSIDIIKICIQTKIYQDKIEIMLAYSDTTKTGGIIDSTFQLYNVQKKLLDLGKIYGKEIIFFHGRGGSFPRGGGSYLDFFNRIPDECLTKLRVTVQGERIYHEFGDDKKIESTLNEIINSHKERASNLHNYTNDYLLKIEKISDLTRLEYKKFINEDIINFFLNCTYQEELSNLNCGSRPSKRSSKKINLEDIRTITWIFGWASINFYLPWWLGYNIEFYNFTLTNEFKPWDVLQKGIRKGLNDTIPTLNISKDLISKFIQVNTIINSKKENLINKVIERKFVG